MRMFHCSVVCPWSIVEGRRVCVILSDNLSSPECLYLPLPICIFLFWTFLLSFPRNSKLRRQFYISSNSADCGSDAGWLVIKNSKEKCSWGKLPKTAKFPVIFYANPNHAVKFSSGGEPLPEQIFT